MIKHIFRRNVLYAHDDDNNNNDNTDKTNNKLLGLKLKIVIDTKNCLNKTRRT